jgi:hypothetical protein
MKSPRGLDKALFAKLVAGDWITRHQGLLICGPTGTGKSWLACALGHKACRDNRSVYVWLADSAPQHRPGLCGQVSGWYAGASPVRRVVDQDPATRPRRPGLNAVRGVLLSSGSRIDWSAVGLRQPRIPLCRLPPRTEAECCKPAPE